MTMILNDIKGGYTKLISDGSFTYAMTLKPNSMKVGSAGPGFRITSGDEKFQLTAQNGSSQRTENISTCNFNDKVLFDKLHRFHGLLDRDIVGRRFNEQKNKHLRTQIIAIAEGNEDTGHLHCAIRVHETRIQKFNEIFPVGVVNTMGKELWNMCAVGGTVVVEEVRGLEGWAEYITKFLFGDQCSDRVKFLPQ